jgi:hypothetical protein
MGVEPTAARKRPATDFEDREDHRVLPTPEVKHTLKVIHCQLSVYNSTILHPHTWRYYGHPLLGKNSGKA